MTVLWDTVGYGFLRSLAWIFHRLPLELALALGRAGGRLVFYFSDRRHVAYADLKAALGPRLSERTRWRVVREHYENFGQMFVEVLRFPLLDREHIARWIKIDHLERYRELVGGRRGAVLLTAHFGNWELLQIVSGILGRPVHVLARSQRHGRLNEYLNRMRESHGSVAVARGMGIRSLLRSLRRGEFIGLLGDQDAGRDQGLILRFLGRRTTVPTGAFELASRTGVPLLPSFIVRRRGPFHHVFVGEPIHCPPRRRGGPENYEAAVRAYLDLLEDFICRYPNQWLWESKRWKYSWTKRLLILSDGKPGHLKQSRAMAARFQEIKTQYGRPGMEYPSLEIEIRFKTPWHRRLFPFFAFFFIPWSQGRLRWLDFFFAPETQRAIERSSADFVISAGASLVPLNLCLARDSRAKSIVLMKPSFPFNLWRYDLAVVPRHDEGVIPGRAIRPLLTPSLAGPEISQEAAQQLGATLRDPSRIKFAVFLGGPTREFAMGIPEMERLSASLARLGQRFGDYMVTTSRRTPDEISAFLQARHAEDPACQLLVIASEDARPQIAPGMMALAEFLIVSPDSISMVSEAVASRKKVMVLRFGDDSLPAKHRRFQNLLMRHASVVCSAPEDLEHQVRLLTEGAPVGLAEEEGEEMMERLKALL